MRSLGSREGLDLVRRASLGRPDRAEDRALTRASAAPLLLRTGDGERLSVDRAVGVADVYAAVRAITEAAATLPLHTYRRTEQGRERAGGRLAELIERPAPAVTTSTFVGALVGGLASRGNVYLGKFRNDDGRIAQLAPLPAERVTVKVERGRPVYEVAGDEGIVRVGPADVLHIRSPLTADGITGLSPIGAVRHALPLADALAAMGATFARNAGRPSGLLKVAGHMSPEQASELKHSFGARHGGPEQAGGVLVLEGDVTWEQLSLSLADAEFVAQRELSTREVARIFNLPPWILGASSGDSLTYSNVTEQLRYFTTITLTPYLRVIEEALSGDRDLAPGPVYCEFSLEGFLRGDSAARAAFYEKALDPAKGWMRREEVRQLENLPAEAPARPGGVA